MNDMAVIGHNNPPDPIEIVIAEYDAVISEAQNWADGEPVADEAQMKAVDAVLKEFKTYKTALGKAVKERTDPLHKAWKAEVAAVKVYTDDADLMQKALVAVVAPFKVKLAEQKEAERRAAYEEAERIRREAEEAERRAQAGNIDELREAEAAKQAALDAQKAAQAKSKDTVKGMRKVTRHSIKDMRSLVNWIATNDKQAMAEFATTYAAKNHLRIPNDIVATSTEKEAF
ncbi:MAG: hypothetical protein AAFR73_12305 [Pseudomonadota bacterium]